MDNKLVIGLLSAAIIGLVGDHVLVRDDLQEEIERSKIKDIHQEKALLKLDTLFDRVTTLEVREGIHHRDHSD